MPPKKTKDATPGKKRGRPKKKPDPALDPISYVPRVCPFCEVTVSDLQACAEHIVANHLKSLKMCPVCERAFVQNSQYDEHVAKHETDKRMLSCLFCPVHFKKTALLKKHDLEKHGSVGPGAILTRYAPYISAEINMDLQRYIEAIERNVNLICRVCKHETHSKIDYHKHLKTCKSKKYVCDVCNHVFGTSQLIRKHVKNNCVSVKGKLKDVAKIMCAACKKFIPDSEFEAHKKTCVSYQCSRCEKVFDTISECNEHFTVEHQMESLKLKTCKYCRMEFIKQSLLDKHVKQHERYRCMECNKMFKTPKPLLSHLKTHKDIEPYKCVLCDVTFKDGFTFKMHITEHGDEGCIKFDDNGYVVYTFRTQKNEITQSSAKDETGKEIDSETDAVDQSKSDLDKTDESLKENEDKENEDKEIKKMKKKINEENENEGNNVNESMNLESDMEATAANKETTLNKSNEDNNVLIDDKSAITIEIEKDTDASELKPERRPRRKIKIKKFESDDSDTEPLIFKKRRKTKQKTLKYTAFQNTSRIFTCAVCSKKMHDLTAYNRHINMHFKAGAKQCVQCAKIFPNRSTLDHHMSEDHSKPKQASNALHRYLKRCAQSKLQALKSKQRESQKEALREKLKARMQRQPFKIVLKKFEQPKKSVTPTTVKISNTVPPSKINDLTLQEYVENFQPDDATEKTVKSAPKILQVNRSKELKIRSVKSTLIARKFQINMRPYKIDTRPFVKGIKYPQRFKDQPEYHEVKISPVDIYERVDKLNYGEPIVKEVDNKYSTEYFETDFNNDDVQQVEVSSTPVADLARNSLPKNAKGYMLQVAGLQTSEQMEARLRQICARLQRPLPPEDVSMAFRISEAPFFQVVNLNKLKKKEKMQQQKEKMKKRFEELKIGNLPMVQVNPLAHLMKGKQVEQPKQPQPAIEVTPPQ